MDDGMIMSQPTIFFKFQSDSINTRVRVVLPGSRHFRFKFQSDSINTGTLSLSPCSKIIL